MLQVRTGLADLDGGGVSFKKQSLALLALLSLSLSPSLSPSTTSLPPPSPHSLPLHCALLPFFLLSLSFVSFSCLPSSLCSSDSAAFSAAFVLFCRSGPSFFSVFGRLFLRLFSVLFSHILLPDSCLFLPCCRFEPDWQTWTAAVWGQ